MSKLDIIVCIMNFTNQTFYFWIQLEHTFPSFVISQG